MIPSRIQSPLQMSSAGPGQGTPPGFPRFPSRRPSARTPSPRMGSPLMPLTPLEAYFTPTGGSPAADKTPMEAYFTPTGSPMKAYNNARLEEVVVLEDMPETGDVQAKILSNVVVWLEQLFNTFKTAKMSASAAEYYQGRWALVTKRFQKLAAGFQKLGWRRPSDLASAPFRAQLALYDLMEATSEFLAADVSSAQEDNRLISEYTSTSKHLIRVIVETEESKFGTLFGSVKTAAQKILTTRKMAAGWAFFGADILGVDLAGMMGDIVQKTTGINWNQQGLDKVENAINAIVGELNKFTSNDMDVRNYVKKQICQSTYQTLDASQVKIRIILDHMRQYVPTLTDLGSRLLLDGTETCPIDEGAPTQQVQELFAGLFQNLQEAIRGARMNIGDYTALVMGLLPYILIVMSVATYGYVQWKDCRRARTIRSRIATLTPMFGMRRRAARRRRTQRRW